MWAGPIASWLAAVSFGLLFPACFSRAEDSSNEPNSENSVQEIALESREFQGTTQLYGEIDLGVIDSGHSVSRRFRLFNRSNLDVELAKVKPSCACTEVKIASGVIEAGNASKTISSVQIKAPRAFVDNAVISQIQLFSLTQPQQPVATLVVRGSIRRPFLFEKRQNLIDVKPGALLRAKVAFNIDPDVSIDQLQVRSSNEAIKLFLERRSEKSADMILEADGESALRVESAVATISHNNGSVVTTDEVVLQFSNANQVRLIPSQIRFENQTAQFVIFRKTGLEVGELSITNPKGEVVDAVFTQLTPNAVCAVIEEADSTQFKELVAKGNQFEVVLRLED